MSNNPVFSLGRIGVFLLLTAGSLFAQFDQAAVVGTVRDERGGAIPAAKVTIRSDATGFTQVQTTSEEGDYIFPSIRIGEYKVTAEKEGFSTSTASNVVVTVNARQRVDLILKVGQVTETITVSEVTPLLETDNSSKGQVITAQKIVELPVLGRTYSSFALLAPGVRQSQVGNQGSIVFRREGSYNVNGMRSVYNNFCWTASTITSTGQRIRASPIRPRSPLPTRWPNFA